MYESVCTCGQVRLADIAPKAKELIEDKRIRTGFYMMRLPLFKEKK